jgi:hypothetical protein
MIDRIITNANIITLHDAQPRAEALAIIGEDIVAIGADEEIIDLGNADTVREDAGGKTMIPGLIDAHIHWKWTALTLREVDLFEVPSREVALQRVGQRANELRLDHGSSDRDGRRKSGQIGVFQQLLNSTALLRNIQHICAPRAVTLRGSTAQHCG